MERGKHTIRTYKLATVIHCDEKLHQAMYMDYVQNAPPMMKAQYPYEIAFGMYMKEGMLELLKKKYHWYE